MLKKEHPGSFKYSVSDSFIQNYFYNIIGYRMARTSVHHNQESAEEIATLLGSSLPPLYRASKHQTKDTRCQVSISGHLIHT